VFEKYALFVVCLRKLGRETFDCGTSNFGAREPEQNGLYFIRTQFEKIDSAL